MSWSTFFDIGDIGVDLAQYGKLNQAMRQLGNLTQLGEAAALSHDQILNLRDIIFKYKQAASEITKLENSDKILATYLMLTLKDTLNNSKITAELFPEFADKEYVSAVINGINDNYNRMWSSISTTEQKAISDFRIAINSIKHDGHYINQDAAKAILVKYNNTINIFLSLCKTESYINEIREIAGMDINNAKHQPEIENKSIDGDGVSKHLFLAVQGGDLEKIKVLVDNGADVNARDENGATPLIQAVLEDDLDLEVIKFLVANGADVNARDNGKYGWPLLNMAVCQGNLLRELGHQVNLDVVKVLVDNGADVNARDKDGQTALMEAIEGDLEVVKFLVANGADVNAENEDGFTALWMTLHGVHPQRDVAKFLKQHGGEE